MAKLIEVLPGERFGKLTVLEVFQLPGKARQCRMACDCGGHIIAWKHNLTTGHTKSCGCERVEQGKARLKHGHSKRANEVSRTYKSWSSMKDRAGKAAGYEHVTVCERWQDFTNFLADMGERPEGKTLDRINPAGNYELSNCRWATPQEQSQNRRKWSHKPESLEKMALNFKREG